MLLPVPSGKLLVASLVVSAVVVASRFVTIPPVLRLLHYDNRAGLMSAIHLSQTSEFALVIMMIGASEGFRHITTEIVSLVVMVLVVTATLSTYLVQFSHPLVRAVLRRTTGTFLEDPMSGAARRGERHGAPIVLVGCFRVGSSLVHDLLGSGRKFQVIDFNPRVHHELRTLGVPCVYGDLSHVDTLQHAGVEEAEVLISSIPDDFLRGTTNRRLLKTLRKLNPRATILVTAESVPTALELYEAGADYVMVPRILAADRFLEILGSVENGGLAEIRQREIVELRTRKDVFL
jgi:voltage-gated potassium channel Kch